MGFVKVVKTNAYFKRFQTKLRRRREGKTDYYARKRLIIQDKDKYNSPKYRFVVRVTNSKVICQIIYATLVGDKILCQANSLELTNFGLTAGLTNYSSCYLTGLLCARRLLKNVGLDSMYQGKAAYGEDYSVADDLKERRPFKAILDIGITRTTTGNRVFGALKGAVDGGLYIPHSTRRFPGYIKQEDNEKYDAKVHRDRIFGVHIDKYMKQLKDSSNEDYMERYSKWDACLKKNGAKSVEDLYKKVHEALKKNFDFKKKAIKEKPNRGHKKWRTQRLTLEQKRKRAQEKLKIALEQAE